MSVEIKNREDAARACYEMKRLTEEKLKATHVDVGFHRHDGQPDRFEVICWVEGRPFRFEWTTEVWKRWPSDFDWDGLLVQARPC